MRREAVERLTEERRKPPKYTKRSVDVYADAFNRGAARQEAGVSAGESRRSRVPAQPGLIALCRSLEQIEAALDSEALWIYADFEFIRLYDEAVAKARRSGKPIALAVPRIHMPGENGYLKRIERLEPDGILVRNTGALYHYMQSLAARPEHSRPLLIGDFSLNIANHKTAALFLEAGCARVTPSYDLNIQQMIDLLRKTDTADLELVIHQHLPMFHTEHCVYCTFLSEGTDYTNCGRPCEQHRVSLRDRIGMSHPVRVDEGCRNTVYNAIEQSGAEYLRHFLELGVALYRVEFLEESGDKVREVLDLYGRALKGEVEGSYVWKTLKATNQLGVTRGQLVK
jgi:putative protease